MIFSFLKFSVFVFLAFFLPGRLILSFLKIKFENSEKNIFSVILGIVLLIFLSFILGWLGLRFLLFPIVVLSGLYGLWSGQVKTYFSRKIDWKKVDWRVILFFLAAVVYQSLVVIGSGRHYQGGVAFWGVSGHDGLWHLTLIQELAQNFPGQNPGYAGETLKNYHYFFDLLSAEIYRTTQIPLLDLYFRFIPLFLAFLLVGAVYCFGKRWSGKRSVGFWSVFFVSFASSLGFVLPWFKIGSHNWETAFWAMQPVSSLQNPPFFLSLILLTAGMFLFLFWKKQKKINKALLVVLALIFGAMMEVKVYGGLIVLTSLFLLSFWQFLLKKDKKWFSLFFFSFLFGLGVYLPTSKASADFVKWEPFWFVRTMVQAPDRMNWVNWELRRQVYVAHTNRLGILAVDGIALGLFFLGNLGTRAIGTAFFFKKLLKKQPIDLFLIFIFLSGLLPTMLFLQKHLAWNTIQFFYYSIFIFSFFAAWTTVSVLARLKKDWLKWVFVSLVVVFSLPSTLKTISWHWGETPTSIVDFSEKEALEFLKENSDRDDVVLTYPYQNGIESKFPPPVPLSYYNSAYVSFFTNRRVYLEDQTAALIQGYGLEERLVKVSRFFSAKDTDEALLFLKENEIRFIYLVDGQKWVADLGESLALVFKNQRARIYAFSESAFEI